MAVDSVKATALERLMADKVEGDKVVISVKGDALITATQRLLVKAVKAHDDTLTVKLVNGEGDSTHTVFVVASGRVRADSLIDRLLADLAA